MTNTKHRIGFVSTRLSGTDGVSLETVKWVKVLTELGHECFYFAGESKWPKDRSYVVSEAHFEHPKIQKLSRDLFDDYIRSPETSQTIEKIKNHLKKHLHKFVRRFDLDLLIVENALAIPMNVPLGLALTEFIAETSVPVIGHHHDFAWERSRFSISAAEDYLRAAFPPTLNSLIHVVINTFARRQLAFRVGVSSTVVPNVMDFEAPPPESDGYADDLRSALDLSPDEYFLLQPTRIVPRKRIERAIELAKRLDLPCTLVISHASGDEGSGYANYLKEYIELLGVKFRFAADVFAGERRQTRAGCKIYSLADAYHAADLVTYPSTIEGFGNAFLEAIYYRKPIVMSTYEIYRADIQPKGFKVIEFGDFLMEDTVRQTRAVLSNTDLAEEIVEHNYNVARRHFSYATLEKRLAALISQCLGD
jgi:glycosyltransferase involved in cell wall biosynthesis